MCNSKAAAAGLGGTWKAWLSDSSTDAITRITDVSPWYLVDNKTLIFPSLASITTTGPVNPLIMDETGVNEAAHLMWTGTQANGTKSANTCSDWTDNTFAHNGEWGSSAPWNWTANGGTACNVPAGGIYCFEQ